ncbi:filamentous hemagglutinin N-terminal domain-containing protein [Halotia wernerae UHCC 0503]|nr:filamentous hemagglutinin N-terminal domain-containing protein [Halotia wernerae UHCC 0503]
MSGITQDWRCWCSSLVMGSVLIASLPERVFAQITPDNTLPNNSSVIRDGDTFNINGGTQAGANLFHSFGEFSVPTGGAASFNNAVDIQNIISRVTGGSTSNIDGLIKTNGTANLFLINPNGIVFGQGARLDIGGSFVGTTANAIGFGDRGFFSASNPESSSSLLSVNPSALLFNQIKTESTTIQNNSIGLRVPDGKSLLLVGGDINMDGGGLFAFGGRVELGGLSGAGTIGLNSDGSNLSLSFPDEVERSNVSLSNNAEVNVASGGGGSIAVNAKNLEVLRESSVGAGISPFAGSVAAQAGDITLNASAVLRIENSFIYNAVFGNGNGGNVSINTGQIIVVDGSVATFTLSQGKGGDLIVKAKNSVELSGSASSNGTFPTKIPIGIPFNSPIGLFSTSLSLNSNLFPPNFHTGLVTPGGKPGNLTIDTRQLIVRDGAIVSASSSTNAKAGELIVNAEDSVKLIGTSDKGAPERLFTIGGRVPSGLRNETGNDGVGGNLTIKTGQLIIQDGAWVTAGTVGTAEESAGDLTINAGSVQLIGTSDDGFPSAIINGTRGLGEGGKLTINTDQMVVRDGAFVTAGTLGDGQGGEVTVKAKDSVELIGRSAKKVDPSIAETTIGSDDAYRLIFPFLENSPSPSGIITGTAGNGKGSDLTINTGRLSIQDGAQASVSTVGAGDGGSLIVEASSIELIGISQQNLEPNDDILNQSLLTSAVGSGSTGKGGDIKVKTDSLTVTNEAKVTVSNGSSLGNAGDLDIEANVIRLENQGELRATTVSGTGGNIKLSDLNLLLMRDRSLISAEALNDANGGNITINAKDGFIVAVPRENSDIVASASRGDGGRINIIAFGIYGLENRSQQSRENLNRSEINASSNFGTDGTVELNTPEIDPNSGLVELPIIPVDTQVAQGCYSPGYAQSSFVNIGRGGLPPNPKDILTLDTAQIGWVSIKLSNHNRSLPPVSIKPTTSTPKRIVEATGAMLNAKGQIVLSANSSTVTPHTSRQNPIQCHGS